MEPKECELCLALPALGRGGSFCRLMITPDPPSCSCSNQSVRKSLTLSWMGKSIPWNGSLKVMSNKIPVYLRGVCSTCTGRSHITPNPTGTSGKGNSEPEFLKNIQPVVRVFYSYMESLECLGSDCAVGMGRRVMLSDPS